MGVKVKSGRLGESRSQISDLVRLYGRDSYSFKLLIVYMDVLRSRFSNIKLPLIWTDVMKFNDVGLVTLRGLLAAAAVVISTWLLISLIQVRWQCAWSEMDLDRNGWISLGEIVDVSDFGCQIGK